MIPLRRPTTLGTRGARVLAWFALLGSLGLGAAQDGGGPAPDREAVAALFAEHCTLCHGGASPTLGLDLGDLQGALRGSDRGPVVVPGDPEASELVMRLRGTSQPRMPLTGPPYLDDEQIGLVVDWIAAGASAGPDGEAGASAEPAAEPTAEPGAGGPDGPAATGVVRRRRDDPLQPLRPLPPTGGRAGPRSRRPDPDVPRRGPRGWRSHRGRSRNAAGLRAVSQGDRE